MAQLPHPQVSQIPQHLYKYIVVLEIKHHFLAQNYTYYARLLQ
jgi:hypothetical protein